MTVRWNLAGLAGALADVDTASLHHTAPGVGAAPAANTEVTGAPYARQPIAYDAPADVAGVAVAALSAAVPFNLALTGAINVSFVGLWKGATYKGYLVVPQPFIRTEDATGRSFTLEVEGSELTRANEA